MSATKYLSPLRIQADQKDIIISQLKEELYHLKKNQQQFYSLQDQYRKLEHKYRLLAEEKSISDADYKTRHEVSLKNICSLRAELDEFKAELRDANLEINDLETDENTLRNQLDQRNIQIEKLKAQLNSLFADADELAAARASLINTMEQTRATNAGLTEKLHLLDIQNEDILRKIADTEKYLDQLLAQEKLLKDKIISYENQNNNLDNDINTTVEDIAIIDNRILDAQSQIKSLQSEIAEADASVNKFKSEAIHYHKATQAEIMKNNDLTKMLGQAENINKVRANEIEEGRDVIHSLNVENEKISITNRKLEDDLQFCRKHLENLALINQDIVIKLQRFSDEDQEVRRIIDRKVAVGRVRSRVQQTSTLLNRTTVTTNIGSISPYRRSSKY